MRGNSPRPIKADHGANLRPEIAPNHELMSHGIPGATPAAPGNRKARLRLAKLKRPGSKPGAKPGGSAASLLSLTSSQSVRSALSGALRRVCRARCEERLWARPRCGPDGCGRCAMLM